MEVNGKVFLDTYTAYAGENASHYFVRTDNVRPTEFIPLACQLFSALAYLASEGVIHRDISPDNILINDDQLCLIDFEMAYSYEYPDPAKRPTALEMEQKLYQVLISSATPEDFRSPGFHPDQPTPVSEENPLLTTLVSGNGKGQPI